MIEPYVRVDQSGRNQMSDCENCGRLEEERDRLKRELDQLKAKRTTNEFTQKMKAAGWTPVDSVYDLLPRGHPLRNKPLPESQKLFKSWEDGTAFEEGKQIPKVWMRKADIELDPRTVHTHLTAKDGKTICGMPMNDQDGTWREGTPGEFSAKPCPGCIRARMKNDEEAGSSESVFDGEGSY